MDDANVNSAASIRLVFELSRAEHPRLFDDLIRFQKGTKRVNRLRVLAYDGLLAQYGWLQAAGSQSDASIGLFQSAINE
jgi:hypothetical protein